MRIKTIGTKISLQVMLVIAVVMGSIFFFVINTFSDMARGMLQKQAIMSSQSFTASLENYKENALIQAGSIARDQKVIEAVAAQDPDLIREAMQQFQDLDFVSITDAEGTVLLRTHSDKRGDSIAKQVAVSEALRTGYGISTIETGNEISLSIRGSAAVKDKSGRIIGAITGGYDLSNPKYVDQIKENFGCQLTIFLEDERFSTTVTDSTGKRVLGTKADEQVTQTVLVGGQEYIGQVSLYGVPYMSIYTPLVSHGKNVGMLFSGVEITDILEEQTRILTTMAIVTLIGLVLAAVIINVVARIFVARPLRKIGEVANRLEQGDIGIASGQDIHIDVKSHDETGRLARALESTCQSLRGYVGEIDARMQDVAMGKLDSRSEYPFQGDFVAIRNSINQIVDEMNNTMKQINIASDQMSQEAGELSNIAQNLAHNTSEQSNSLHQLTQAVEDVHGRSASTVDATQSAYDQMDKSQQNMQETSEQMTRLMEAMDSIDQAANDISNIIKAIEDIAFQTNILALNAAVEAARAGQHGKGFAVVADEVRNLAAKTADSSQQTNILIQNTVEAVQGGLEITRLVEQSVDVSRELSAQAAGLMMQVKSEVDSQAKSIDSMNYNISNISQAVEENTATSEMSAASSEELASQANLLHELVKQFQLEDDRVKTRGGGQDARKQDAFSL